MLADFTNQAPQKSKALQTFLDEDNNNDYRTAVHALKSTAKTIGANALSDQARVLEKLAKENDTDALARLHPVMMRAYAELAEKLKAVDM